MADRHDDCRYWGLTTRQCYHCHRRVFDYYAHLSRLHAEQAARFADKAGVLAICASVLAAVAVGVVLVAQVGLLLFG